MSDPIEFAKKNGLAMIAGTIILIAVIALVWFSFLTPHHITRQAGSAFSGQASTQYGIFEPDNPAVQLSGIVLVGLVLTVFLMAILVMVHKRLGVADPGQPLGLPEGSVRSLLAFSLVLIFVCVAAFLFDEVNEGGCTDCKVTLERVPDTELSDLKNNFVVAAEQATDADNKLMYQKTAGPKDNKEKDTVIDDLKHPIYRVTYYPKQSKDASDFAKQIFTTLATVFVSVVSFYFGSSVTSSANKAGAAAAKGPSDPKQSALTNALADSHNADVAVDLATKNLDQAKAAAKDSSDPSKDPAVVGAQTALDNALKDRADKQAKVAAAQNAIKDSKSQS